MNLPVKGAAMTTGAKMRVYEIAKELKLQNKELIAKIRALGLEVNNHMSSLSQDEVIKVKRSLERERRASTETKRLSAGAVIRRRSKGGDRPVRRRAAGADTEAADATQSAQDERRAVANRNDASATGATNAARNRSSHRNASGPGAANRRQPNNGGAPATGPQNAGPHSVEPRSAGPNNASPQRTRATAEGTQPGPARVSQREPVVARRGRDESDGQVQADSGSGNAAHARVAPQAASARPAAEEPVTGNRGAEADASPGTSNQEVSAIGGQGRATEQRPAPTGQSAPVQSRSSTTEAAEAPSRARVASAAEQATETSVEAGQDAAAARRPAADVATGKKVATDGADTTDAASAAAPPAAAATAGASAHRAAPRGSDASNDAGTTGQANRAAAPAARDRSRPAAAAARKGARNEGAAGRGGGAAASGGASTSATSSSTSERASGARRGAVAGGAAADAVASGTTATSVTAAASSSSSAPSTGARAANRVPSSAASSAATADGGSPASPPRADAAIPDANEAANAGDSAASKPKSPVFFDLPASVSLSGSKNAEPAEKPAAESRGGGAKAADIRPARSERGPRRGGRDERGGGPGGTARVIADEARNRFEQELQRARKRATEREAKERERRQEEEAKLEQKRDPSRPAVGSVISLPVTKIKITERPTSQPGRRGASPNQRDRFQGNRNRTSRTQKRGDFGRKRLPNRKQPGKSTQITRPAEHKRVIRMEDTIAILDLARAMGVKANEVLKKLWGMGMIGVNINAAIDVDTAQILASEFDYEVQNVAFKEDEVFTSRPDSEDDLMTRSPVVTVMGHVDHGKTSLLDAIRAARVAAGEAGGITQHIAAYKVSAGDDYGDIVFLDTPGHEAFTAMRARGAQSTDIAVLVVASNDGVMPQTLEALSHAKDAKVSIIVAVNKCDLPDAQPERVRQQLAEHGLIPEEWGGDTLYVDVSAITGEGIPQLLEVLSLTSELLELKANPVKPARGVIIEAKLDRARGPMATILVQEGTLRTGDVVVAGSFYGKVRAMLDDTGKQVREAGPSTPVELLGMDGVPAAGELLNVAEDEKTAKQVVEHRRQQLRKKELELASTARFSIENLMSRIQEGENHELKVVLKTDVQGSAEALKAALIKQSTEKVKVNVIQAGVGGITESDVNLAKAGGAIILGFHVRPAGKSAKLAEQEGVEIRLYDVIYEALDDVRAAMAGMLAPIKREMVVGQSEVRNTFNIPKMGTVAGCMVTEGKVQRKSLLRVIRDAVVIYEGRIASLRRFKEDTAEVREGYECGIMVHGFNDVKVGDVIESYEIVEEAAQL